MDPEIEVTVTPGTKPEAETETQVSQAIEIAKEISKADETLFQLKELYSLVNSAIAKIDSLESSIRAVSGQVDGLSAQVSALMVMEIQEETEKEEQTEEIIETIVGELETEVIPAIENKTPESSPPEENRQRKRGFF